MSGQHGYEDGRPKAIAREVRMNPKVVFWVVFCVTLTALMTFSMMFVMAAYRNDWW